MSSNLFVKLPYDIQGLIWRKYFTCQVLTSLKRETERMRYDFKENFFHSAGYIHDTDDDDNDPAPRPYYYETDTDMEEL